MLTKSMAAEFESAGIRVNCVRPGVVGCTDFLSLYPEEAIKEVLPGYMARVIGGHQVTPEEVADSVIFLSSPAASGINGASILIDGGFSTR